MEEIMELANADETVEGLQEIPQETVEGLPEIPNIQESIVETTDGRAAVVVDEDVLAGVPKTDWVDVVRDNLKEKFPNGVDIGNENIKIDGQSRREMTFSKYMQWLYRNDPQLHGDKLRATNNSDEILKATTGWVNEEAKHSRKDRIVDFARGNVLLRVGENDYTADVVVGTRKNGNMVLYDVLNMNPTSFTEKETGAAQSTNPSPGTARKTAQVSTDSIRGESENVNEVNVPSETVEGLPEIPRETVEGLPEIPDGNVSELERTAREYGVSEVTLQRAKRLSKLVGREVVFFSEAADASGGINNGYYDPSDGKIHINAQSENLIAQIISHELTHTLEQSGSYGELQSLIIDRIGKTGGDIEAMRQAKKELYARHGVQLNDETDIDAEIVAEYVEKNLLTSEAKIRELVQENRTLGQRILDWLNGILAKLGNEDAQERDFITRARNSYAAALQETQSGSGEAAERYSLSKNKVERLTEIIRSMSQHPIEKMAGDKKIRILTDDYTVDKAIFSTKGRSNREVNARIAAIPDFTEIVKASEYWRTDANVALTNKAKNGVTAMHYFTGKYGDWYIETVVRDKGSKQYLYEVKFHKNNPQQTMPPESDLPAPKGDVEDYKSDYTTQGGDVKTYASKEADRVSPVKRQFNLSEPVERTETLLALHNMDEDKLRRTLNLGAWPSPSVAIVEAAQGHSSYGEFSAVFPRSVIDPETDGRNRIYGRDAYTPSWEDIMSGEYDEEGISAQTALMRMLYLPQKGNGENGILSFFGAAAEDYASVDEARGFSGELTNAKAEEEEGLYERIEELYNMVNMYDALEGARMYGTDIKALTDFFRTKKVENPEEVAKKESELIRDIRALPRAYFEAKPQRMVDFGEVLAVVSPDSAPAELLAAMRNAGMNVVEYRAGNEQDRLNAINRLEGAKFSISSVTPERDAEYLAAAESGDTETAQRMVDEAAEKAGYTIKAYHGTSAEFTVFDKDKIGSNYGVDNYGFFFSSDKDVAKWAADEDIRYSIETLPDGKKYVRADRQVIFGNDPESWSEQLEDYINGKIRRGQNVQLVAEDGDILTLTADTAGKVSSMYDNKGKTLDEEKYARKVNAGAHIDELAQASTRGDKTRADYNGRHGEKATGGWNYRSVRFQDFDGKYYKCSLSTRAGSDGTAVYNIGEMQERNFPTPSGSSTNKGGAHTGKVSSESAPATATGTNAGGDTQRTLSGDNISDNVSPVKRQNSVTAEKKTDARLKREFTNEVMELLSTPADSRGVLTERLNAFAADLMYTNGVNRRQARELFDLLYSAGRMDDGTGEIFRDAAEMLAFGRPFQLFLEIAAGIMYNVLADVGQGRTSRGDSGALSPATRYSRDESRPEDRQCVVSPL